MMDGFMKLSREAQAIIAGSALLVILSFLDWQQVSYHGFSAGVTEWHGIGILAALLAIALLLWELARLFGIEIPIGSLTPGLASVGVALLLVLFTVITFLSHSTARHWPAWIGVLVAIGVGVAAVLRAKGEGVEMPKMPAMATGGGTGGASTSPPSSPAAPPEDTVQGERADDDSGTA
jgi:hypothetical protein